MKDDMSRNDLIPQSPTSDDYAKAHEVHADESLFDVSEPFELFGKWLHDARAKEINDANAMAVATVDEHGMPDVRMTLLKDFDQNGFVFYTNTQSQKGQQILSAGKVALLFHWKSLRRQVRIRGLVEVVTDQEADAYFQSRARDSQIGAWASEQSRPLESRFALEKRIAEFGLKFGLGPVPRPPHWTGFRIKPVHFEFWRDRPFRLHDRLCFDRTDIGQGFTKSRLYP